MIYVCLDFGPTLVAGEVRVERNVPVPMRDGVILRADVFRPAAPGRIRSW